MKASNIYITLFFSLSFCYSYCQEPADALRYSFLTREGGTARNQAIGGAGASLGGEFTSLFINPAGLGFYKTGDFAFTPSFLVKNSKSDYKGSSQNAKENNSFHIGTSGLILASPSRSAGAIKNFAIGIGVNRVADFNSNIYYKGTNQSSSYAEKYLEELVDNQVTDLNTAANGFPYGSSLAFNTYLIDTIQSADGTVGGYRSLANPATGLIQENNISTSGGITEFAVGGGFNLRDKWYFGGTVSFPFLRYTRNATYRESDASGDDHNNFNYFEASESLRTKGIGVNGKFGVIFKPVEDVRLGLAVYTPTFYGLTDDYTAQVLTDLEGYGGAGIKKQSSTDLTSGEPLESKYNLITPWRAIFSGSYVFHEAENTRNQRGFVTADVEYVNYRDASFQAINNDDDAGTYYKSLNQTIDHIYQNAFNLRLGGELKFNTLMVRLGGAYYGNPYKNESADLVKVSGGLGYRNRGVFIDLTYVYSMDKDVHYPYLLEDKPNTAAFLKNNAANIIATIGFKL